MSASLFIKKTGLIEERGVLGGPTLVSSAQGAELDQTAVVSESDDGAVVKQSGLGSDIPDLTIDPSASLVDSGEIKDIGEPVGPALDRSGMVSYTVQKGDTLSEIASNFQISAATITNANPGAKGKALKVGQSLKILPTSGVVYTSQGGDSLSSIATTFAISQATIQQFNQSVNFASLDPGTPVIIPGGTDRSLVAAKSGLPNFNSQFIMPANGYNWGILHHYNAVDIANSCGTPVVAAAEGLVIPDPSGIPDALGAWNGGYGNYVLVKHVFGDNVETRYAHLEKVSVQIGDYVKQGQVIGLMGESGEATGCHVHFEVIGAQNPFAKS